MAHFMTLPLELRRRIWCHSIPGHLELTGSDMKINVKRERRYKLKNPILPLRLINHQAHKEVSTIPLPTIILITTAEELTELISSIKVPLGRLPNRIKVSGKYRGWLEYNPAIDPRDQEQRRLKLILAKRWDSIECTYTLFTDAEGQEVQFEAEDEDEAEDLGEDDYGADGYSEGEYDDGDPYAKFELWFDVAEPRRPPVPKSLEEKIKERDEYLMSHQQPTSTTLSRNKTGRRW